MLQLITRSLPNLFTIGNLICGVSAITLNMEGLTSEAALVIFLAAFLDLFDGRIARKLKVNSEFGVELDSLADVVSFGVAPALIFHTITPHTIFSQLAFILFPTLGALRLARFSAKPTVGHFIGIPITLAGLIIAGMEVFLYTNTWITIALAILMVSPIKVKKF
ncbi:CDP-diacylglycerol--serine O-phosphatidyltransferase [Bacillus sp. FJAT-49736]|uniref:CDP-diacylglycerol--serine O-phosphatidyltransferase n=1 Tax=Bacillus sp. FJAT-49736 TaxID=2833582 RepID=UPI001BCA5AFD|nr:CDP-diacylglycerol--serine O-phosphatidyltransferase [Bacillus sp. FJAT-49736]MBS4172664.1 CDP-diacylglycerol--serine O-phosphatidyltransferase [Bacillus sp. FJAT-49736]